eukprot:6527981-Pyramimonas_sp.AAC.2
MATKRVRSVLEWGKRAHAVTVTGAFAVAPRIATKRVRGMRSPPRGPSVELPPYGATRRVRGVPK